VLALAVYAVSQKKEDTKFKVVTVSVTSQLSKYFHF